MTDAHIIIPSAGRADMVLTNISGACLFVPEGEADKYRKHNPDTLIETHPDDAHKNLAEKRQDIYTRWRNVFMVDDDITEVNRLYLKPSEGKKRKLTPDEAHELIQVTAANAKAAGCYLYGFNNGSSAQQYRTHKPIQLESYINACAFGLHWSEKLYFTSRTTAAESHWINLLNAREHRMAWSDMRFNFMQKYGSTFYRPGGQAGKRTLESDKRDTLFLRRMFGQAVQVKTNRKSTKAANQYQRTIVNPL